MGSDEIAETFRIVKWREGYDAAEVDAFVGRVNAGGVTPEAAKAVRFTPTRLRPGYDMGQVDDFLDTLIHRHIGPRTDEDRGRWRRWWPRRGQPWNVRTRKAKLVGNVVVAVVLLGFMGFEYASGEAKTSQAVGQVMPSSTCVVEFTTPQGRLVDAQISGRGHCADPVGSIVTVWFDPSDPSNASLEARSGLWVDLAFGGGISALIVGYSLLRWRLACRRASASVRTSG